MRFIVASTGSYPRIGDAPEAQRHRQAYARRERGELSEAEWQAVEDEVSREVVAEQRAAGVALVTDGQVRWYDPFSHVARALTGVHVNGLLRYFDTNFYFRQPVVRGPLARRGPLLRREFEVAAAAAGAPAAVKPVVPGPYSLACASILEGGYASRAALAEGYAAVLAAEVADLAAAGAPLIQVDEPCLLQHPADVAVVRAGLATLAAARGAARLACYTYFGDATPLYDALMDFPVEVIGLDFTYAPGLAARIAAAGTGRVLGLGLVDARNTRLETREGLAPVLDRLAPRLGPTAYLNPSSGLELLPRARARAKLALLARLAAEYAGPGGA